jgi:hypothetical protein
VLKILIGLFVIYTVLIANTMTVGLIMKTYETLSYAIGAYVIVDIVDRVIKIFERGVTRYGNRK